MQAIILAAGMGRRLGKYTESDTKCMIDVNGQRLIDRTLNNLFKSSISQVIIVVGYIAENVISHIGDNYKGMPIIYIHNNIYDKTNNIYSLYLAKNYLLEDDTILLESDLIYEEKVLSVLIKNKEPNLVLVDKYESWMDGSVITLNPENNTIRNLFAKDQFDFNNISEYYKTVNIYKFSKSFSKSYYVPFLEAYSKALGNNIYYEQVLKVIIMMNDAPIKALPLNGEKWYEIDDIQDLDIAKSLFAKNDDEQWQAYTFRYGGYWRYPKLLDFCYLVNSYFPPQKMLDEMHANFDTLLSQYPSSLRINSMLAAKNFEVDEDYIVPGNGAAELIKSLIENHTNRIGVVYPTFEEYPNRCNPKDIVRYVPKTENLSYSATELIDFFDTKEIDTFLLINPDNPSGNYIVYNDLIRLIQWAYRKGIRIIIDESFVDFAKVDGIYSLFNNDILEKYTNLIVIKSISKSYGVPGLRLGVMASGDRELISEVKKDVSIWNINSFAEFFMQILGKYKSDYLIACDKFKNERNRFYNELCAIKYLKVIPSQANYFMCKVNHKNLSSRALAMILLKNFNILIKDCSGKEAMNGSNHIRIAIRDNKDDDKLINALKTL